MAQFTDKWRLTGKTEIRYGLFEFTGDRIEEKYYLIFLVNGIKKMIPIQKQLKSLMDIQDEVKDGNVYYKTDIFTVTKDSSFFTNPYWYNGETVCLYTPMPSNTQSNSALLCDTQNVMPYNITQTDTPGIKTIGKVLAIRVSKKALNITSNIPEAEWPQLMANYFSKGSINIIYQMETIEVNRLEDYAFPINEAENVIECLNTPLTNFEVQYPIEVIINTSIDVKEIQRIGIQVSQDKTTITNIKINLDELEKNVVLEHENMINIEREITAMRTEINAMESRINTQKNKIDQIELNINAAQQDVLKMANEIKSTKASIDSNYNEIVTINTNLKTLLTNHNQDQTAHTFIQDKIKKTQTDITTIQTNLNETKTTVLEHADLFNKILNDKDEIDITNIDLSEISFMHSSLKAKNLLEALNELIIKVFPPT